MRVCGVSLLVIQLRIFFSRKFLGQLRDVCVGSVGKFAVRIVRDHLVGVFQKLHVVREPLGGRCFGRRCLSDVVEGSFCDFQRARPFDGDAFATDQQEQVADFAFSVARQRHSASDFQLVLMIANDLADFVNGLAS
jgi:hypothetical protein